MAYLRTAEAARLLNVSPNTLRAWERRFGFPQPTRSEGGHRQFRRGEIASLRDALRSGLSISSAIAHARDDAIAGSPLSLVAALHAFDGRRANRVLELSFATRSVEETVEEVLVPALDQMAAIHGARSARWAFSAEWAMTWIRRGIAFAGPSASGSILIGIAFREMLEPEVIRARLLELLCRRAGIATLAVSVLGVEALGDLLHARAPDLVVISGIRTHDDAIARWAYAVHHSAPATPLLLYSGYERPAPAHIAAGKALPCSPLTASERVLAALATIRASHPRRIAN
jgi:DNA-binding transcriptional MerR regulator